MYYLDDDEYKPIVFPVSHTKTLYRCPSCRKSYYAYCRECGSSYQFGTTSICRFDPKHTENEYRLLHCSSCGAEVDKEGVIVDRRLIPFPFVVNAYNRSDKESNAVS